MTPNFNVNVKYAPLAIALTGMAALPAAHATIISATNLGQTIGSAGAGDVGGMQGVYLSFIDSSPSVFVAASAGSSLGHITASPLSANTVIGGGAFGPATAVTLRKAYTDHYDGAGAGLYGVSFIDSSGSGANYGWIDISLIQHSANLKDFSLVLNGYGWDNSGATILAGQTVSAVPEPDALAMWALGAITLAGAARRRRRGAASSQ